MVVLRRSMLIVAAVLIVAGCRAAGPKDAGVMEEAAASRSEAVGRPAPDFVLPDADGKLVSLGDLRGKWVVLYFYPKDDTPGCTCQANEFTALLGSFKDMNAEVLGISADPPESHRQFAKTYHLKVRLLSDQDHRAMEQYGAWVKSLLGDRSYGRVIRTTFIIDPMGRIRHEWPEVIPQGHAERVREKLAELQKEG